MAEVEIKRGRLVENAPQAKFKVVVRLIPPVMKAAEFFELVKDHVNESSVAEQYYFQGHHSSKPYKLPTFSRAYVNFKTHAAMAQFVSIYQHLQLKDDSTGEVFKVLIQMSLYPRMPGYAGDTEPAPTVLLADDVTFQNFAKFKSGELKEMPSISPVANVNSRKLRLKEKRRQKVKEKREQVRKTAKPEDKDAEKKKRSKRSRKKKGKEESTPGQAPKLNEVKAKKPKPKKMTPEGEKKEKLATTKAGNPKPKKSKDADATVSRTKPKPAKTLEGKQSQKQQPAKTST
ncbi:hypothetical protein BABINDRAFT_161678 [Babjeviella inositovora NRRL Y-12698]|uniref:UPF3 domain-containing protein n=1 Tax=Babjeviella inositovora NRRL Y-12698 TaxID=984486 RepID=A0A1E3QQX6_9ASCO|nr:uncharacterized protein BABINDRAFT_161678 [Babjeviella inositovora NRRL Y-12698]ODQ80038.1 hypothetical protein BABINDRAFT_161678 [Babjeviella inositovora NRRL Y-12698]